MLAGVEFVLSLFAAGAAFAAPLIETSHAPSVESQAMDIVAWHAGRSKTLGEFAAALPLSDDARDQALRLISDLKLDSSPVPLIVPSGRGLTIGTGGTELSLEFVARPRASWKIGSVFVPLAGRPMREAYEEILKTAFARRTRSGAAWSLALPRSEAQISSASAASSAPGAAVAAAFAGHSVTRIFWLCSDSRGSGLRRCSLSDRLNARILRGELTDFQCSDNGTLKSAQRISSPGGGRLRFDFQTLSTSASGQIERLERSIGFPSHSRCQLDLANGRVATARAEGRPMNQRHVSDCNAFIGKGIDEAFDFPIEGLNACCGDPECRSSVSQRAEQDRRAFPAPNPRSGQRPSPFGVEG